MVGCNSTYRLRYWNKLGGRRSTKTFGSVATVLTACGIETSFLKHFKRGLRYFGLQQYLPLAVLKRVLHYVVGYFSRRQLQQYLPLAVLKLVDKAVNYARFTAEGCNSTYRLRYWNMKAISNNPCLPPKGCNSTYRLRYWNEGEVVVSDRTYKAMLQQYLPLAVLKPSK